MVARNLLVAARNYPLFITFVKGLNEVCCLIATFYNQNRIILF